MQDEQGAPSAPTDAPAPQDAASAVPTPQDAAAPQTAPTEAYVATLHYDGYHIGQWSGITQYISDSDGFTTFDESVMRQRLNLPPR